MAEEFKLPYSGADIYRRLRDVDVKASVKTMSSDEYNALGADEINSNTLYMLTDLDEEFVQPDWEQTVETAIDYIKNKPDIDGIVADINVRIDETRESVNAITPESIGADISGAAENVQVNLDTHASNTFNPHNVTAAQVGAPTVAEMEAAISAIPTPDVNGQINAHNANTSTHADIRSDIKELSDTVSAITVPTKVSELTNDSGYLTSYTETDPTVPTWAKSSTKPTYTASEVGADAKGTADLLVSSHNVATDAHNDIRIFVEGLSTRLNALADSDDTTLDQMSEIVAYIKNNKSLIEGITTNKVNVSDIIDNLTTNVSNKPLSAAQGVALKALIDAITIPVISVNGKTGAVQLDASDVGAVKTQSPNDMLHNSNEFTFVPAGHSGELYINHRTASGALDGAISNYHFGNGKGGEATLIANYFKGKFQGADERPIYNNAEVAMLSDIPAKTENWTFTLEDGSTVTKAVYVG